MICSIYNNILKRFIAGALALALAFPSAYVHAQAVLLPPAGDKVALSASFEPALLSALTVDPENPLQFQFFVDPGQMPQGDARKDEYLLLVKDFMVSLTIPEDQLWVNLSPYEKDRIIDDRFGLTEMGRDLLAQDYMLKQITASLIYPEEGIGKDFWAEVYRQAQDQFGTTDIPVDTFNKVWIMPDVAEVYQQGTSAMVLKAHLKVMLESDYLAMDNNVVAHERADTRSAPTQELTKSMMRQIIIPALEKEVNQGKNFARLRQIYNALILATWYKKAMHETFLGKAYVDQGKVKGIEQADVAENQRIYNQYVQAFRQGVFNYIKEEVDRYSGETIPRKYLSGGFTTGIGKDFSEKTFKVRSSMDASEKQGRKKKKYVELKGDLRGPDPQVNKFAPPSEFVADIKRDNFPGKERMALMMESIKELAFIIFEDEEKKFSYGSREWSLLQANKERMVKEVKGAFDLYLDGEEHKQLLVKALADILDKRPETSGDVMDEPEEESALKKQILSGTRTQETFDILRGLAMMSRTKDEDVPYQEILGEYILKLHPELIPRMASVVKKFKTDAEYKELFLRLMKEIEYLNKFPQINEMDDTGIINDSRSNDGQFIVPTNVSLKQWTINIAKESKVLFQKKSDDFSRSLKDLMGTKPQIIAGRPKGAESLNAKFSNTQRSGKPAPDPREGYDYLGLRFIYDNPRDLFKSLQDLLDPKKQVIFLKQFWSDFQAAEQKINKKLARLVGESLSDEEQEEKGRLQRDLARIEDIKKNFKNNAPIVARVINYYSLERKKKTSTPKWYNGVHVIFMLGHGAWTIEVQFKSTEAFLHDWEHKYYKGGDKNSPLNKYLIPYIYMCDIVQAANQLPTGLVLKVLREFDKSEITGGIDVRNVNGAFDLKGQRQEFGLQGMKMSPEAVEGFSPEIISVMSLEGLPFLQEAAMN
jgi:hypothetical protein